MLFVVPPLSVASAAVVLASLGVVVVVVVLSPAAGGVAAVVVVVVGTLVGRLLRPRPAAEALDPEVELPDTELAPPAPAGSEKRGRWKLLKLMPGPVRSRV